MIGDQTVNAIPKAGDGFDDFKTAKAGEVTISRPGDLRVVIKPLFKLREYVIDLRSIVLLPADTPTEAINISGDAIEQSADGSFKLAAGDAQINGTNAALVGEGNEDKQVGFWKDVGTSLLWTINVQQPGKYRVELKYSQINSDEGAKVAIVVGDQSVKARPTAGKDWLDMRVGNAGEVTIDKPGNLQVSAVPVSKPGAFMINLFSIGLLPVETPTQALDIRDKPIKQLADGSIKLAAADAEIDGETIRLEGGEEKYLAWRSRADSLIKWPVKIDKPGTFRIEVTYSLARSTSTDQVQFGDEEQKITATLPPAPSDRSKVSATVAGQTFVATLRAGSGWDDFKTEKLGSVTVSQGGNCEVIFSSPEPLGTLVMHLQSVSLVPVGKESSEAEPD
jgi:predicted secreted protein